MTRAEFVQAFVVQHCSLERALKFAAMLEASEEAPWDDDEDDALEELLSAVDAIVADREVIGPRCSFPTALIQALADARDAYGEVEPDGDDDEVEPG